MGVMTQTPEARADDGADPTRAPGGGPGTRGGRGRRAGYTGRRGPRSPYRIPVAALIAGLALTGALTAVSRSQYLHTERRLLRLRVGDAGALLSEAVAPIQLPLEIASELADATRWNAAQFRRLVEPDVGNGSTRFASISLWQLSDPRRGPLVVAGAEPKLAGSIPRAVRVFAAARRATGLTVVGLLSRPDPSLGYIAVASVSGHGYAVEGERPLPADRRSRYESTSEFAGLNYAVYLGVSERPRALLLSDVRRQAPGTTVAERVPFGAGVLTLVMSARASLQGGLPEDLPWIIAVAGVLLTVGAALVALVLVVGRRNAERLAERLAVTASENERLYAEQRGIAQTLQHALLPDALPQLAGTETRGLYRAGADGVDIGGDWYDVIDIDGDRLLLVVGDVSGRGLRAATTMAELRFAIRAYAMQGDPPEQILAKLSDLLDIDRTGQFATVLCVVFDRRRHELSVTSAGHLPPLLIDDRAGRFVSSEIGAPIGVGGPLTYTSTTIGIGGHGTLLAYTDGLVERRGESLDDGLSRLREMAVGDDAALAQLIDRLASELAASSDDIAILGLRWTR